MVSQGRHRETRHAGRAAGVRQSRHRIGGLFVGGAQVPGSASTGQSKMPPPSPVGGLDGALWGRFV